MSILFDPSSLPPGSEWIAPHFAALLQSGQNGTNPYTVIIAAADGLFHPSVPYAFAAQMRVGYVLFGISILLILVGLAIRVASGRFWIFHRLDGTITLPNTSVVYGLCSLVYSILGLIVISCSIDVASDRDIARYYVGTRMVWVGPLWLGAYIEAWATLCGWYIRKKGAFYQKSLLKSTLATVLPFLIPVLAWAAPTVLFYLAATNYNTSYRISKGIIMEIEGWQAEWQAGDGLQVDKLLQLFEPGAELGDHLIRYSDYSRVGNAVCAGILLVTLVIYTLASVLEIQHLTSTISSLRAKAVQHQPANLASPARSSSSNPKHHPFFGKPAPPPSPFSPTPPLSTAAASAFPPPSPRPPSPSYTQQQPWTLLLWVRRNRIWSVACIVAMVLVNTALQAWQAATRLDLRYPSGQFQVQVLACCWLNGILSTLVSLLLLFRSLDSTSSPLLASLRRTLPFLPFPPPANASPAGTRTLDTTPQLLIGGGGGERAEVALDKGIQLLVVAFSPSPPSPSFGLFVPFRSPVPVPFLRHARPPPTELLIRILQLGAPLDYGPSIYRERRAFLDAEKDIDLTFDLTFEPGIDHSHDSVVTSTFWRRQRRIKQAAGRERGGEQQ
ncbi:hypothetical protein JCM8547_001653 [Rhodosporidiobolus lusitaniae]